MDSIPLEMDEIFGEEEEGEDFNLARLPDLDEELEPMREAIEQEEDNGNIADGDGVDPEVLAKLKSMSGASKLTARRTIPKLDVARLTGVRGIPVLPKVFKDVPIKGKNHECEDLKVIMRHLEHWGHRLFPKMPFSEVLERIERLGAKNPVKTCVKRIRMDLPVFPSEELVEDETERAGDDPENRIDEDEIEALMRDQEEGVNDTSVSWETVVSGQPKPDSSSPRTSLPDEVKARIERNKKLAMERRAAKLALADEGCSGRGDNCGVQNLLATGDSENSKPCGEQESVESLPKEDVPRMDLSSEEEMLSGEASMPSREQKSVASLPTENVPRKDMSSEEEIQSDEISRPSGEQKSVVCLPVENVTRKDLSSEENIQSDSIASETCDKEGLC